MYTASRFLHIRSRDSLEPDSLRPRSKELERPATRIAQPRESGKNMGRANTFGTPQGDNNHQLCFPSCQVPDSRGSAPALPFANAVTVTTEDICCNK